MLAVVVARLAYDSKDPGSMLRRVVFFLMSNFFVNEKDSLIVSFGGV